MSVWSIGEVEEITGIKTHILRYWEEVIPSFAPKKDIGGRRIYTSRDIQTVMRLKYLIQEKKFTIEGARNQLITETAEINSFSPATDSTAADTEEAFYEQQRKTKAETLTVMATLRAELLDIYMVIRKYRLTEGDE